jgi:hypothetical protein
MITMSTLELRKLLTDLVPFASTDEELPAQNCVRLELRDGILTGHAHNMFAVAERTWTPDDEEADDSEDAPIIALYEADQSAEFSVRIRLTDAQNIIKAFALKGNKKQGAPISITVETDSVPENTYKIIFRRPSGGPAWTPLTFAAAGRGKPRPGSNDDPEGDLHNLLARYDNIEAYLPGVNFSPKLLAAFGKTTDHGPIELAFTGEGQGVRWKAGNRFRGILMPIKSKKTDNDENH